MKNLLLKLLPALALVAGTAQAQVGSGSFGASIPGWDSAGDVIANLGTLSMTTAYNAEDDAPFNLSGTPAAYIDQVESGLGLAPYTLDLADESAYEGSFVRKTLTVAAGDTLSFAWSFASLETQFHDRAFVVIGNQAFTLATRETAPAGPQSASFTFTEAGSITLGFGVVDTGDVNGVSLLNVSRIVGCRNI